MPAPRESSLRRWFVAWVGLDLALALHVADEAMNGFLPLYNQTVEEMRTMVAWFPFPTFTFRVWLSGLIGLVVLLFAVSPFVLRGQAWLRPIAYFLAVVMTVNAIGHTLGSLYWGMWVPGVYSSPVLFIAAAALFITTRRAQTERGTVGGV